MDMIVDMSICMRMSMCVPCMSMSVRMLVGQFMVIVIVIAIVIMISMVMLFVFVNCDEAHSVVNFGGGYKGR